MLSVTILLLLNGIFYMLRLSGGNGSFPRPLSAEEEQEYLRRFSEGDMQARNVLIERNLRLVAHIIKKDYTQVKDQDDLISIGTIGLIKGIASYNPDKGVRLATYAARCIENAILSLRLSAAFKKPRSFNFRTRLLSTSGGKRCSRIKCTEATGWGFRVPRYRVRWEMAAGKSRRQKNESCPLPPKPL